jgi:protein-disulfide isomerase
VLATILREYGAEVRLVFKDMPLRIHDLARSAHEAARCAGAEGRYWPYHDRLFAEQPRFQREHLIRFAEEVGLDGGRFARCLDERRYADAVEADVDQARALGITGTPTFLINGRTLVGAHPVETFREIIAEALGRR